MHKHLRPNSNYGNIKQFNLTPPGLLHFSTSSRFFVLFVLRLGEKGDEIM